MLVSAPEIVALPDPGAFVPGVRAPFAVSRALLFVRRRREVSGQLPDLDRRSHVGPSQHVSADRSGSAFASSSTVVYTPSVSRPFRVLFPPEGRGRVSRVLPPSLSVGAGFSAELTGVSFDDLAAPPRDLAVRVLRSLAVGMIGLPCVSRGQRPSGSPVPLQRSGWR